MKCKYCEAELEEGVKVCPSCGAELEETPAQESAAVTETAEEAVAETVEETTEEVIGETTEETTEEATKEIAAEAPVEKKAKKKVAWQTIVAIVACIVALICLAIALLSAFGLSIFNLLKKEEPEEPTNVGSFVSEVDYTGTEKQVKKAGDKVVATMNGVELTNKELQIYYNSVVQEFLNNYYQYLEQLNLDLTLDLNTQACYFDETVSWEAYFVDMAITTWQNRLAVTMLADEDGFTLSDETKKDIEAIPENLKKMAEDEGFESVDELISERMGGQSNLDSYLEFLRIFYTGAEYSSVMPSDEELSEYFDGLSEMFSEYGVTKESGPMVDVRHILFQPEGGTVSEDGLTTTYTDEEWAACLEAAEAVFKEWKEGEATEATFAELANTHSMDPGSNTNGGLYTQITSETTFVEPFLTWCMDESRKIGDTDIVKTEHGYHIMYFSASEPLWLYYAKSQYVSDRTTELMETGIEKWPMETDKDEICIEALDLN